MKSVRFHNKGKVVIQPIATTARNNGIKPKEVPALIEAWVRLKAVRRRDDGGLDILRWVDPKDPQAMAEMRRVQEEAKTSVDFS